MRTLMSRIRGAATGAWLRRITVAVFIGLFAAATPNLLTPEPQAVAVPGGEPVDYSTNTTSATNYAWSDDVSAHRVSQDATWEQWIYPTGRGGAYIDKRSTYTFAIWGGTHHWAIWGNSGNNWTWINTGIPARFNEWQHVAWVKDSSVLKLYVDGQEVYTATYAGIATLPARGTLSIQNRISNPTENFLGRIDEVRIWGKAKTQSEILADMHNRPVSTTGLQAYYDFNDLESGWVQNTAPGATADSHLRINGDLNPTDVKEIYPASANNRLTTYVFPRSYITRFGGWRVPSGVTSVEAFLVGGGGGGGGGGSTGYAGGGGGGAEVLRQQNFSVIPGQTLQVAVGQGGRAGRNSGDRITYPSTVGQATEFGSLEATFGGAGGNGGGSGTESLATTGASGGGGALYQTGAAGISGKGFAGGDAPPTANAAQRAGGGGGGVLGLGGTATNSGTDAGKGGAGGPGAYAADTRTLNFYAAGGSAKGCKAFGTTQFGATPAIGNAAANSGSGGGGGGGGGGSGCISSWYSSQPGGWGGSGVIAVSFVVPTSDGTAAAPLYYPEGPQTNIPLATVLAGGWEVCYQGTYNQSGVSLAGIWENCTGEYLMLAGRDVGTANLRVLAAAPRSEVLEDTANLVNPRNLANGSQWYYSGTRSMGFAKGGDALDRRSCDVQTTNTDLRLCWHTSGGNLNSGWSAGTNRGNYSANLERLILQPATSGQFATFNAEAGKCAPITYTKTISGTEYTIHEFLGGAECEFDIPAGVGNFELYAVGGGGGGGNNVGGGGGGGGSAALSTNRSAVNGQIKITVGAGGAGGVNLNSTLRDGQNGFPTTVENESGTVILNAAAGIGGQSYWANNVCSGSGGKVGSGGSGGAAGAGGSAGGAGGLAANPANGANGSNGYSTNFTGDERFFGGGGGGGGWQGLRKLNGIGGVGGGGAGAYLTNGVGSQWPGWHRWRWWWR